jgi:hypothetical protein
MRIYYYDNERVWLMREREKGHTVHGPALHQTLR